MNIIKELEKRGFVRVENGGGRYIHSGPAQSGFLLLASNGEGAEVDPLADHLYLAVQTLTGTLLIAGWVKVKDVLA